MPTHVVSITQCDRLWISQREQVKYRITIFFYLVTVTVQAYLFIYLSPRVTDRSSNRYLIIILLLTP